MGGVGSDFEQLLLGGKQRRDRSMPPDQLVDHALLHGRLPGVGRTAVHMHERIPAAIDDQVAVPGHFDIAGILPEEGDGDHLSPVELPAVSMGQLDHLGKPELAQQRQVIEVERAAILSAGDDDRDVFRQVQQSPGIHMVVMIVRQKDGGRAGEEATPE